MPSKKITARVVTSILLLASLGALVEGGAVSALLFLTAAILVARYDPKLRAKTDRLSALKALPTPSQKTTTYPAIALVVLAHFFNPVESYYEEVNNKTSKLWGELQEMKSNPEFHEKGYAFNDWNDRRQKLYIEWSAHVEELPIEERFNYGFGESLSWMYALGKDYYQNTGKLTAENEELARRITWSIKNDGKSSSGEMGAN